jgi:hypothetical protein
MTKRVHVTIPAEVEDLFNWMVRHDEQFRGKDAAVVAHFFAKGIRAAYDEALRSAEPLDADDFTTLADHARDALRNA